MSSVESKVAAPTTSRRRVLKLGLAGGALLLLGGSGLALYPPSRAGGAPTAPLLALDGRAFQVLVAVAARIVTAAGADPVAIAHGVDRALSYALAETQSDVRALLGLFENALAGFVFDLRLTPFTRLSPSAQDAALESWRTSRLVVRRTGYQALRKLCLASFYVQESSWPELRYAPPSGLNAAAYDDPEIGTPEWIEAQNKVRGS